MRKEPKNNSELKIKIRELEKQPKEKNKEIERQKSLHIFMQSQE